MLIKDSHDICRKKNTFQLNLLHEMNLVFLLFLKIISIGICMQFNFICAACVCMCMCVCQFSGFIQLFRFAAINFTMKNLLISHKTVRSASLSLLLWLFLLWAYRWRYYFFFQFHIQNRQILQSKGTSAANSACDEWTNKRKKKIGNKEPNWNVIPFDVHFGTRTIMPISCTDHELRS